MYQPIPNIRDAAVYARTDMQKLTREILRIEGIAQLRSMTHDFDF